MPEGVAGMSPDSGRWVFVIMGALINICLGAIYAFSVFRTPLEELWGISATRSGMPFMVFLAVFGAGMALAGRSVDRWGPRKIGVTGGVMVGLAWVLAGLSSNILILTLLYGVLGGAGVGVLYGCPIAVSARWFPDRKGLAVGLTVMGFGLSALVVAPMINALIVRLGPLPAFSVMGAGFLLVLVLLSLPLRFPPEGWRPSGWNPPTIPGGSTREMNRSRMIRTGSFRGLWICYTLGCLAGLMAIGISAPFGREVALLSPGSAALAVSLFAVFNGTGRPLFGWLTDRNTPRAAGVFSFVSLLAASAALRWWGRGNSVVYFTGFSVLWLNLGGWLAIAPTATASFFGTRFYGENYGIVFTAYGLGAILGMVLSGLFRDLTGSYQNVFLPVMVLAGAGAVLAALMLKPPTDEDFRRAESG